MITIRTKERGVVTTMEVTLNKFCEAMRFRAEYLTPDMTKAEFKREFHKHGIE